MKQETAKKMPKWLLPVIIAAAVLAVAGILLAIFLPGLGQGDSGAVQSKLYWNVDREANIEEESGMSMREKGADGLYAIRFAVDGEQVEYKAADKRLVNAIDMQDLMGLVFDADGLIVDIIDPKQVATEVAKDFFVKEYKDNTLVINSSQAMNGMPMQIEVTENTGIYNVSASADVVGQRETDFTVMDKVIVYANEAGETTHIFVVQRFQEAGVYYRLERKYDTERASTTREPDENGVYTVEFAHNGEVVGVKIKDKALVDTIDAGKKLSSPQMGLLFDEEGYAIKKVPVEEAIRGKQLFGYWHVTGVEGTTVNVQARWASLSAKGETGSFELPEDFKDIFLIETDCGAPHAGVRVDGLQKDDLVYVYTDFENNPLLIFIIRRNPGYPLFYNSSVKYDSTAKETTRTPDENGYYVFEVAGDGVKKTVKTKDKAIATKVDMQSRYLVGLKLEGDIIVDACSPVCVTGRSPAGSGRYVTELLGSIVRMVSASDMTSGANYVINPECKVYDVSDSYGVKYGSETTLRVGDRVQAARNPEGELAAIYVYARYEEGSKLCFFPSRKYDSKTKQTTRVPDEEGYYVYEMCCEGKWVTYKTKDKAMATYIDKQSSKFVALRVSGDIIKGAYNRLYAIKYGYDKQRNHYYSGINEEGKMTGYTMSNGVKKPSVGHPKAANCVVYNASTAYRYNRGEKTTLQKDDKIYCFGSRENFQISQIWVRGREIDSPLYWGVDPQIDDATGETTRTPAADGYYYIDVLKDGKIVTVKTKDKALASAIDDYSYAFGLIMEGDVVLRAIGATGVKGVEHYDYRNTYVKAINGDKAILIDVNPASENYGKDLELVFTKNSKIYDARRGEATFGEATQLKVGDKIASYQDEDGKVVYCFITERGAVIGECEACYQAALATGMTETEAKGASLKPWLVYDGTGYEKNMHYYLTADYTIETEDTRFLSVVSGMSCLDLRGHSVTATGEADRGLIYAYNKAIVNVMDTVGGGKLTGHGDRYDGNGTVIELRSGTPTVNVYGGSILSDSAKAAIGVHASGTEATINICGGTVEGINAVTGAKVTLSGAPKISNLTLGDGVVANIDGLKPQAEIKVNGGSGKVLTAPSANAAAVKGCFVHVDGAEVIVNSKKELVLHIDVPEFSANSFTTEFDPAANGGYGYCEACYQQAIANGASETKAQEASLKQWKVFAGGDAEKNMHYYLDADFENYSAGNRFMVFNSAGMICWNLNGHSVSMANTTTEAMVRAYSNGVINIMDAKGTGVLTGYEYGSSGTNGGTVVEVRSNGIANIYGGTFRIAEGSSANVAVGCHTNPTGQLNIFGGDIEGVYARTGLTVKLAGAPKITGLAMSDGHTVNIDSLLPEAQISVKGSNGKVFTAASDNAETVKGCFTAVTNGLGVDVNDQKQLVIVSLGTEPGPGPDPDAPEVNDEIFTTGFDPAGNNGQAYCEACYKQALAAGKTAQEALDASLKEWNVFTGGDAKEGHYYLNQNFDNYSATDRFLNHKYENDTVCFNLNGFSVTMADTTTEALARVTTNGVLNIMDAKGTGTLTGYEFGGSGKNGGTVVEVRSNGIANIYGGTFRIAEGSSANVAVGCHTNPTGQINIYGGDIEGVYTRTGITLKLAGAPVITNLTVATDVVANIDELATGAQISVKGDLGKVISNASDNAAAVKNCFTAAEGLDVDVNDQKQLVIVEATAAPEVDPFTDGFDPAGNNGQAYCEACYKQALAAGKTEEQALADSLQTWTVFEGGAISADGHYYLEQSYTGENAYNATRQFMTLEGKTVCFNLNGQSIMMAETAASGKSTRSMFRIQDGSTLNIMDADGTAEMTGFKNVTVGKYGGSVAELWNASNLNIYGGIFRLTEGQTAVSAIGCGTGDYAWTGTLNVYGGDIEGIYHRAGTVNLIGAPKITKLYAVGGATYNIDGLLPEAQIAVVGELDLVFTAASDNAAAVKNCFTAADDSLEVVVTTEGALALAEKQATQEPEVDPFTDGFDPANNNNMAHCEACYQQALAEGKSEQEALDASLKEWTVFTGGNTDPDMHYYLTENYENYSATSRFMSASQDGTICWNLNGHSVSMAPVENNDDAEALARADRTTLNIMDAKGTGVLTGYLHNKNAGTNGGSVVEAYQSGVVNIYGGTFLRDTTQSTNVAVGSRTGSKVYSGAINIYGGTIDGVYIRKTDNTTLTNYLAGAPVITGLDMTTGADINIDGLLPEAQISVKGSEGRVLTTASDNAAAVKGCFTSVNEGLVVDVNDQKQLVIVEAIAEPDPFTDGFDPAGNNGQAYCEACYKQALAEGKTEQEALDASLKTWTVYAGGAPTGDAHYYLAETVESYTAEDAYFMLFPKNAGYNICLNLNGKSIAMALDNKGIIVRGASTLNIMDAKGSGVLTGSAVSGTGANGGSVVEVRDTSVVNFYGGSFQRSTAEGAKGNDAVGSASGFTGAINVYGGTFDGIFVRASGAVNLINAPVINGLDMGNDAVVNIDGLTGGSIVLKDVTNEQVISNANATVANTVKGYFTVADEGLAVDVNSEGKLVIVEATPVYAAQNVVDWVEANKAAFRGEGKLVEGATVEAPCPFCSPETSVTWTGIVDSSSNLASGCHLYLIGDRNKAKGHNFLVGNTDEATECVYFNGFNVGNGENTSANRIRARGNLNIIAYGSTVTRSANCQASTSDYGTVMIQGGGTANFYGGTYINNDSRVNLIALTAGSHNLSFYDATLTDNSNVAVENKGTLNLYNCTLTGAEGKVTINNNIGSSSAIAGIVNVYGGTVNGDIVNMEGSVNVEGQDVPVAGQLNLYDNAVINGQLPTNGVNYPQQGNQEQEPSSQANKT